MATYFSDAMAQPSGYGTAGGTWAPASNPTSYNPNYKRPAYLTHARVRKKKMAFLPTTFLAADQIVLGTFKSSDRIWDLRYTQNGTLATGTIALGFYRSTLDHVPVSTSDSQNNLLASGYSITPAQTRTDFMIVLGTNGQYRGLPIWQLLDLGTPTIARDPQCEYDLVMTIGTGWTTVAPTIAFFEADYVSFG